MQLSTPDTGNPTETTPPPQRIEQLTGEQLANKIRQSFYLENGFHGIGPWPPHGTTLVWGEITGLPCSGKHTINSSLEQLLITLYGPDRVVTEVEIEQATGAQRVKEYLRQFDSEYTPFNYAAYIFTNLTLFGIANFGKQSSHKPWFISNYGPLAAFQMMIHANGAEDLQALVEMHKLKEQIWDSPSITQLATQMDEATYTHGMNILASRVPSMYNPGTVYGQLFPMPFLTTTSPMIFISGRKPENCYTNLDTPTLTRPQGRPYGTRVWSELNFVTMRFVHALMIKTAPHMFIEVNTGGETPDYANSAAREIHKHAQDLMVTYAMEKPVTLPPTPTTPNS